MERYHAYHRQTAQSWTRIDMLLALYDVGLRAVAAGVQALEADDATALQAARFKVNRVVVELLDGLNPEFPETTEPIRRLLHFSAASIATDEKEKWSSTHRVLSSLREAYAEVREDAVGFESTGQAAAADREAQAVSMYA